MLHFTIRSLVHLWRRQWGHALIMTKPRCLVLLITAMTIVGCSEKGDQLVPISGRVYYQDKPLEFGSVMLQPMIGQPATALIQPDGTFELETPNEGKGVRQGLNKIRITCYESQRPNNSSNRGGELALGKSLIPVRYTSYTSGLEVNIQSDENEPLDLRLTD